MIAHIDPREPLMPTSAVRGSAGQSTSTGRLGRRRGRPCTRPGPALLRVVAAACLLATGLNALAAGWQDVLGALDRAPGCLEMRVLGLCQCGPVPCGYRVRMYVPVAIAETVRAPGDSVLADLPWAGTDTLSSSLSMTDNTAEVHAWQITNASLLAAGPGSCLACQPSAADLPAMAGGAPGPSAAVPGGAACPSAASVTGLLDELGRGWSPLSPRLVYASELDVFNWRTGCRDLAAPGPGRWACAPSIDAIGPANGAAGADPACLGAWGPLYPRQMRDIGNTPLISSAKTALRAMSIAGEQLGRLSVPVDVQGRLQQVYPVRSACFEIGRSPLPQAPWSASPPRISPDGRHAWIYWRPVSCCVGFGSLARCAGMPGSP